MTPEPWRLALLAVAFAVAYILLYMLVDRGERMADSISIVRMAETDQYMLRIVLDRLQRDTFADILAKVPALVAEQYARDHAQEIMDKVSASEVVSCIAAAVAAKVAESYSAKASDAQ